MPAPTSKHASGVLKLINDQNKENAALRQQIKSLQAVRSLEAPAGEMERLTSAYSRYAEEEKSAGHNVLFFLEWVVGQDVRSLDNAIIGQVVLEMARQNKLWGVQTHPPKDWLGYLVEEMGEVAQAINDHARKDVAYENYEEELVQVAAVACSALRALYLTHHYGGK